MREPDASCFPPKSIFVSTFFCAASVKVSIIESGMGKPLVFRWNLNETTIRSLAAFLQTCSDRRGVTFLPQYFAIIAPRQKRVGLYF